MFRIGQRVKFRADRLWVAPAGMPRGAIWKIIRFENDTILLAECDLMPDGFQWWVAKDVVRPLMKKKKEPLNPDVKFQFAKPPPCVTLASEIAWMNKVQKNFKDPYAISMDEAIGG